jgi:hypothetical protein
LWKEQFTTDSFYKLIQNLSAKRNRLSVTLKQTIMRGILSTLAIIVIIGWAIGYFGYQVGGLFHLILVIALIAIVIQLIPGRRN